MESQRTHLKESWRTLEMLRFLFLIYRKREKLFTNLDFFLILALICSQQINVVPLPLVVSGHSVQSETINCILKKL